MSLYAESSAVLAWLLDEAAGVFVRQVTRVPGLRIEDWGG
jgi:hypothetical protein